MPKPLSSCSKSTRQYVMTTISKYEAMEEVVALCKSMDFPILSQHSDGYIVWYECEHCDAESSVASGITHESDCIGMRLQSLLNEFTIQEVPGDPDEAPTT